MGEVSTEHVQSGTVDTRAWSRGLTDVEGTGSGRSQEDRPGRGQRKGRDVGTVVSEKPREERASGRRAIKGQIPRRAREARTGVSIESANRGPLGVFARTFWRRGEGQAMTACRGVDGGEGVAAACQVCRTRRG